MTKKKKINDKLSRILDKLTPAELVKLLPSPEELTSMLDACTQTEEQQKAYLACVKKGQK